MFRHLDLLLRDGAPPAAEALARAVEQGFARLS
jgi:hypothetical protein